jgi:hypothetical protein
MIAQRDDLCAAKDERCRPAFQGASMRALIMGGRSAPTHTMEALKPGFQPSWPPAGACRAFTVPRLLGGRQGIALRLGNLVYRVIRGCARGSSWLNCHLSSSSASAAR